MNLRWYYEGIGEWLNADQALYHRPPRSRFADWLRQCCIYGDAAVGQRELMKDLHDNYLDWCRITGAPENERMSVRMVGLALSQRQIRTAGKNARGMQYRGPIRLRRSLSRLPVAITHPSAGLSEQIADQAQAGWYPARQATPPEPVLSDLPSPPLTPAAFVAAVRALLALTEHPATPGKPWKGVEQ